MDLRILFSAILISQICNSDEEWRWKNNERRAQARYDVVEETEESLQGPSFRPPPNNYYPVSQRPIQQGLGDFGINVQRPGQGHPGILTGPIPSWERQPRLEKFDRCKCAESFNCNTPGISYGQCDTGKQYCCYRSKSSRVIDEPIPSRPIHSLANGVLVGPGGPVDVGHHLGGPSRPGLGHYGGNYQGGYNDENVYSLDNGVLSGPGGPTDFKRRSLTEADSKS
ncbi:uncharacterized protein LOC108735853 [Agrilus planipennis]|uniref:Uncharacterized protein LOC108735853 n=1 Tax=Agrilus planipennis TaxID=224129 RepID=A0A1W4WHY2_AGRPL|nr:uncharacterized protein LOC108735853 [Agrilus planipennis]